MTSANNQTESSPTSASSILRSIASGKSLRQLTPVVGEGVPEGLHVRVLSFSELVSIERDEAKFIDWYAQRTDTEPKAEGDAKATVDARDQQIIRAALQVASIAVDENNTPIFRPREDVALPDGAPLPNKEWPQASQDLFVGMLQVLAFVPIVAIGYITRAAMGAVDAQRAALGKGSSTQSSSSS